MSGLKISPISKQTQCAVHYQAAQICIMSYLNPSPQGRSPKDNISNTHLSTSPEWGANPTVRTALKGIIPCLYPLPSVRTFMLLAIFFSAYRLNQKRNNTAQNWANIVYTYLKIKIHTGVRQVKKTKEDWFPLPEKSLLCQWIVTEKTSTLIVHLETPKKPQKTITWNNLPKISHN